MYILLSGVPGAMEILKEKLLRPEESKSDANIEERVCYNFELTNFLKADNRALLILTTNITEDVLQNGFDLL